MLVRVSTGGFFGFVVIICSWWVLFFGHLDEYVLETRERPFYVVTKGTLRALCIDHFEGRRLLQLTP